MGTEGVENKKIIKVKKSNTSIYKEQEIHLFNFKPFYRIPLLSLPKKKKNQLNLNEHVFQNMAQYYIKNTYFNLER